MMGAARGSNFVPTSFRGLVRSVGPSRWRLRSCASPTPGSPPTPSLGAWRGGAGQWWRDGQRGRTKPRSTAGPVLRHPLLCCCCTPPMPCRPDVPGYLSSPSPMCQKPAISYHKKACNLEHQGQTMAPLALSRS
eukprot:scaffold310789_cov17-Prasinocladus_malaysianus.AAC.1